MGYYSDIGLAVTKTGAALMRQRLASPELAQKARGEIESFLGYADRHIRDSNGHEAWVWSSVKWYINDPEFFPEVDFLEKLMGELAEEDFRFIRIGEDYDDTEVRGGFWENPFDMELERGISFSQAIQGNRMNED